MVTETATRNLSYIQAINEALRQEMRRDPAVIVMGEDVAGGAGREDQGIIDSWGGPMRLTKGLITEFGAARVRDTPISEAGFIGAGVGAAATGLRPVVELMYVSFFGVCADQITNNAAKMRYMFGGKITSAAHDHDRHGRGPQHGGPALRDVVLDLHALPRPQGRGAIRPVHSQGPDDFGNS